MKTLLYTIYQHTKHPEYRLIVPRGADLPPELRDEWTLCTMTDRIEAEQEEDIAKSGWYLYRCIESC